MSYPYRKVISTLHQGYADFGQVDVTIHDHGDQVFALWDGGPTFGIMAIAHKGEWVVSTGAGHFEVVADQEYAIQKLLFTARTWGS